MNRTSELKAAALILCGCMLLGCSSPAEDEDGHYVTENISSVSSAAFAEETAEKPVYISEKEFLECNYYNENTFIAHDSASEPYDVNGSLFGGVVTHHLLAGKMISGFFKAAAENRGDETETVVVIAPMHYPEESALCTSLLGWQTPFGDVKTDAELSKRFISELGAEENDRMLSYDHSASSLIPYIKYYLPEAETACLLISARADRSVPEKLSALLKEMSEEKSCLFVFSIDFSHYLSPIESEKRDRETLEAVTQRDVGRISLMTDDNLDSPHCMRTFLYLTELMDGDISVLDHGNSLTVSGMPYVQAAFPEGVTSYFIFGGTN